MSHDSPFKCCPASNSNTWMSYRFRRPRSRTTYVLLGVNIVLYAVAVHHWISSSVTILGDVAKGKAHRLIASLSPIINVRVSCSLLQQQTHAAMKAYHQRFNPVVASVVDLRSQHHDMYSILRLSCWGARFVHSTTCRSNEYRPPHSSYPRDQHVCRAAFAPGSRCCIVEPHSGLDPVDNVDNSLASVVRRISRSP